MKTKFIGIPKEDRTAMRKRAREALIHWKVNHVAIEKRFMHGVYFFDSVSWVRKQIGDSKVIIEFVFAPTDGMPQKYVIFDVTSEQWVKDLFNQLIGEKQAK